MPFYKVQIRRRLKIVQAKKKCICDFKVQEWQTKNSGYGLLGVPKGVDREMGLGRGTKVDINYWQRFKGRMNLTITLSNLQPYIFLSYQKYLSI